LLNKYVISIWNLANEVPHENGVVEIENGDF